MEDGCRCRSVAICLTGNPLRSHRSICCRSDSFKCLPFLECAIQSSWVLFIWVKCCLYFGSLALCHLQHRKAPFFYFIASTRGKDSLSSFPLSPHPARAVWAPMETFWAGFRCRIWFYNLQKIFEWTWKLLERISLSGIMRVSFMLCENVLSFR